MHREASGTGGGPSSRQTLSGSEQRVLAIMGLTSVIGQPEIEERGFDEPQPQCPRLPSDSVHIESHSHGATDQIQIIEVIPTDSIEVPPPSEYLTTPPPISAPTPIDRTATEGPRRRSISPLPAVSPTTSTPRRRRLFRARTRRVQTPFEGATTEFAAVENRRVRLEEERERNYHQREMERLRIEERQIEMEESRSTILYRLAGVLDNLSEILPKLRPSSLPSTDTL